MFEILERIEINLFEEKATMDFLKHEGKPHKKVKVATASMPSHAANTNALCFKYGKPRHLRTECKKDKIATSHNGGFCFNCSAKRHNEVNCWKLHPELKPTEE
jgi:hypothetical protein